MTQALSFDSFISGIHRVFEALPDARGFSPNLRCSMKDAALGAFAMFFTQSPSFLAHQQAMEQSEHRNNARSLFGIEKIPSDNQVRTLLDPVAPEALRSLFNETLSGIEMAGHLDRFRTLDNHLLVIFDGTQYFRASTIHCPNCTVLHHQNGKVSYSHSVLTPVLAAPFRSEVLPLDPEFVIPQDGSEKQDCELNAAKRWIERHKALASRKVILLGDDLFSKEPFCLLLKRHGFSFLLVCKPDSHKTLYDWITLLEGTGKIREVSRRIWNGRFHEIHRYRFANELPIKDGEQALLVNWVGITVIRQDTRQILYHNAFLTDLALDARNVVSIVEAARSRWKVENENFNVLKTKGYHLEHNFGHGSWHLSAILLTLNLLAFLAHTLLQLVDATYQAVRKILSARKTFFHDLATLTKYLFFDNWGHLLNFMYQQLKIKPKNRAKAQT